MTPFPPNPPEPHPFIPGSPGWLAYERGRAAADSWWRSRLEGDETVEAVARATNDLLSEGSYDWQDDLDHEGRLYCREFARRTLAALLPVAERPPERCGETWDLDPAVECTLPAGHTTLHRFDGPAAEKPPCRAPHCFSEYGTPCGTCPAEKPETP